MTVPVISFHDAMSRVPADKKPHLLLGNGFSRACRNDIFAYDALFDRADFSKTSPEARATFSALRTTDFEVVMKALKTASAILAIYGSNLADLARTLNSDAASLREVLVHAIADNHPAWPGEIDPSSYQRCRAFLSGFERIYTMNYDLLLYWALMHDEGAAPRVKCDDGFRSPGYQADYVTWEPENIHHQNIYYLHGALHVFDEDAEVKKYTWSKTGVRLVDQIRSALEADRYPLIVAEGDSRSKLARIKHSDYLSKAYRSFVEIRGSLVIYGHSLAVNDEHYLRLIERGRLSQVMVRPRQ